MKQLPLLRTAALCLGLLGPAMASAENWAETGHYKMLVDRDSIHKGPDGRVYFVWQTTQVGMVMPPKQDSFDCVKRLYYSDGDAKGTEFGFHTMIDRLFDFVCV